MPKSWEQILGGYATDTLTAEEKRQLFEAALHDQPLFDTLADEEGLKVLLADPDSRQRILTSLQASGNPQESTRDFPRRWRWFRQPSSLAWAGSIAAAGLALIFGWQMNQDWGAIVQEEQEADRSVIDDQERDENKVVFRSQPAPLEVQKPLTAFEKNDEGPFSSEVPPQSVIAPMPEADTKIAQSVDSLGYVQEEFKKERREQEEGLDSSSQRMQEQASQASETLLDQEQPQVEPVVQASAMPDVAEVVKSEPDKIAAAHEAIVFQAAKEEPLAPPGALDRFYSSFVAENQDNDLARADTDRQVGEKVSADSSLPNAKRKNRQSLQGKRVGGEDLIPKAQGIRYSFIRKTGKKEEELAEGQQITGDWRDVRLAIEPNEAGFLYVFAPIGRGNWQQLAGVTTQKRENNPDGGNVQAYQVVEFNLGVISNRFGKLVVSSFTVLFSLTPLEDVGKWVSGNVNMSELEIERTDNSVFVVRSGLASDAPFRVDIILEE